MLRDMFRNSWETWARMLQIGWQRIDHSFCILRISKRHPPSPNAICNPGLVDVIHRGKGRPRVAPGSRWPSLASGVRTRLCALGSPWPDWYWFTRATSISLRATITPYLTSNKPAIAEVWVISCRLIKTSKMSLIRMHNIDHGNHIPIKLSEYTYLRSLLNYRTVRRETVSPRLSHWPWRRL